MKHRAQSYILHLSESVIAWKMSYRRRRGVERVFSRRSQAILPPARVGPPRLLGLTVQWAVRKFGYVRKSVQIGLG